MGWETAVPALRAALHKGNGQQVPCARGDISVLLLPKATSLLEKEAKDHIRVKP